jgi:hypothetical protein
LGHSSINVTLDRYGHLFPELDIADAFHRVGFSLPTSAAHLSIAQTRPKLRRGADLQ